MKYLFGLLIVLVLSTTIEAQIIGGKTTTSSTYNGKTYESKAYGFDRSVIKTSKNIYGGENFYKNGKYIGRSTKNIYNGFNYYFDNKYIGNSRPNINGGSNYYFNR